MRTVWFISSGEAAHCCRPRKAGDPLTGAVSILGPKASHPCHLTRTDCTAEAGLTGRPPFCYLLVWGPSVSPAPLEPRVLATPVWPQDWCRAAACSDHKHCSGAPILSFLCFQVGVAPRGVSIPGQLRTILQRDSEKTVVDLSPGQTGPQI